MTDCLLFLPGEGTVVSGAEELIQRWDEEADSIIWLHITGELSLAHQDLLTTRFHIHPLAMQDAMRDRHPPKLEEFEDHTFLIFKTLSGATTDRKYATLQSILFVGERFLLTRSSKPCAVVKSLWEAECEMADRLAAGPDAIASRLMRLYVDQYMEVLLDLEVKLEALEVGLLDQVDDNDLAVVTGYKANLKRLRRTFLYHERILRDLRRAKFKGFHKDRKHELTDVYEQQERAGSLTLLYYELASDLIDGYLSLSSHRLNQIMKVLTIVTAIFVPLGFLAGIYGMNFENIPELNSRNGYFILLGAMVTIATTLLLVFRKKGWL